MRVTSFTTTTLYIGLSNHLNCLKKQKFRLNIESRPFEYNNVCIKTGLLLKESITDCKL